MRRALYSSVLAILVTVIYHCSSEGDFISKSDFQGIEGQILIKEPVCDTGCTCSLEVRGSRPDTSARIDVYLGQDLVVKGYADASGRIKIHLDPGSYDLTVYPSEAFIDTSLNDISVSVETGVAIRRSYKGFFLPREIGVSFHDNVDQLRINEILEENNLTIQSERRFDDVVFYRVEIPHEVHVQEMQNILESNYVEVESTQFFVSSACAS